ncbi:MAG: 30S ribosomal protein S7 [Candidatus Shikimatogenerans bostrichidophilus]|nr:MAG: 30S ribosomal protein S7 [Candidatus Shikimatogenerans bostrichidophilus]
MRKIKKNNKQYIPDVKYNSRLVTYFINHIMKKGKKNIAYKIFYKTLDIINDKFKLKNIKPLNILKIAIKNASPEVKIKTRKIGGSTYSIPVKINENQKKYLSIKWLIVNAKNRKEKNMSEKLANEIISTYNGISNTIKNKHEIHKRAESNKAFSHFKF